MTATELQQLFEAQLNDKQRKKVFYMTVQGTPDITGVRAQILAHDLTADSWDDLLASLQGYTYQDTVGDGNLPRFVKDTA